MEYESPKRFDRIVAILIQLQSKRTVKARELADRFQVSLRTIYRDIRSLNAAGVPIYGEAGTGYSMMEGYRLPPVMFTKEEAGSFAAAEKLMQHFADQTMREHFESAMYKIKSVLRGAEKDWIEALGSHISILSAQHAFNENIPDALEILFESVARKKRVVLDYKSPHSMRTTNRSIEVVGIFHENRHWYILGYCHLRKDYRHFRIDRIQSITRCDTDFKHSHETVSELRKKMTRENSTQIKILVEEEVLEFMKYDRDSFGFVSEKRVDSGQVEMTFNVHDINEGFSRWFLMYADYAHILSPESMRVRVGKILNNAVKRLNE